VSADVVVPSLADRASKGDRKRNEDGAKRALSVICDDHIKNLEMCASDINPRGTSSWGKTGGSAARVSENGGEK